MKNKKMFILLSIIILLILIGLLISFINHTKNYIDQVNNNRTRHYIDQANNNLNMGEIKLLGKEEDMQDILKQKFKIVPGGFGCTVYSNEKDEIEIRFSRFPDVLSAEGGITYIETKNPMYSFYDVHVGDDIDKSVEILEKNGFKKSNYPNPYAYLKDKISTTIEINAEGKIEKIIINLITTNKNNIVF